MNIKVLFEGVFLGVKENKTEKGTYYNISLECNDECGTVSCTKEVCDNAKELKKYSPYQFEGVYNTNYKNLRVVGVV